MQTLYLPTLFLIFNILLIKKYTKQTLLALSLVSLIGSILAFYHFGIEQGFLNESFICESQNLSKDASKEEILRQLKENTISCKNVTFRILVYLLLQLIPFFLFYYSVYL